MFQFDSIAARAMLTTVYANGLDIYPDEFAHLIHGSAPTKAQVAEALESALSEHQAILTNELRDINGWWDRKGDQHQDDINHLGATADRAATQLITKTMGVMRQHRAILIGQYQADYEGRHPEYSVNWPGTEGDVPKLGEHDDEPNSFFSK
jgi:hypothetical protein